MQLWGGIWLPNFCLPIFSGIDVIIPIPLHKKKQQIRGYNQSEWIARGIAAVTGIPIDTELILRKKNTETQTRKSVFERRDNVEGIFELQHPETLAGKHILIVDDVLTTGSTTLACASCLVNVEGIRISILRWQWWNKYGVHVRKPCG